MKSHPQLNLIQTLVRVKILGLILFLLVGCQAVALPASGPPLRNIFLTAVGVLLFLAVLFYGGFKAFLEHRAFAPEMSKAEQRTRAAGFLIGLLSAILLIALDSAPGSFPLLGVLAFFSWYILIILGTIFGFCLAILVELAAAYRPTSGTGFLLLVVTFISAAGLYLILFANGLQGKVLAATLPVFIGLLLFRMLFPGGQSSPNEKEFQRDNLANS